MAAKRAPWMPARSLSDAAIRQRMNTKAAVAKRTARAALKKASPQYRPHRRDYKAIAVAVHRSNTSGPLRKGWQAAVKQSLMRKQIARHGTIRRRDARGRFA